MALKFEPFKPVRPEMLLKLKDNLIDIFNEDSISAILSSLLAKIENGEELLDFEARILLDWYEHLDSSAQINFKNYLNRSLGVNNQIFEVIASYFHDLKQVKVVGLLISLKPISNRLGESKLKSFNRFVDSANPEVLTGRAFTQYIEDLRLLESSTFTIGQKQVASQLLPTCDLSELFEAYFESLLRFISNCGIDSPALMAKFLDRQLGYLINEKEAAVTAKVFRKELGYFKYIKFVESNRSSLEVRSLKFYLQLKRLVSEFEEAVRILSEHEAVRGTFWSSNIEKVDGIKMKHSANSKYKIAVAFLIGNYVFCDFGPTGNQIHIYDLDVFLNRVEKLENWQQDVELTKRIQPNKYPHQVSAWQDKTLSLIRKAQYDG